MTRLVLALVCLIALAGRAEANNTISTAQQLSLGEKRSQVLTTHEVAYFGVSMSQNRSYAAFCWLPTFESQVAFSGFCAVEIRDFNDVNVGAGTLGEGFPKGGLGSTFTSTTDNAGFIRIVNQAASTQTATVIVLDTTLASPWYFVSPGGGYDAYVEVRNHSTSFVSTTIRAYAASGTLAGSTTVSLPANGNTVVTVSSLGVSTGSGSVTITHNALPGSIVANTTTLSVTTGLSFDSPFAPRMVWSIF